MITEFTLTAMRRPATLRDTLESFALNLHGASLRDSTLYLNVDPLPEEITTEAVVAVAKEFFGRVVVNAPAEASFPAAVKWCWAQPKTEYFWHSEDDWLITEPVELSAMFVRLLSDKCLSVVNLRAYQHDDERICLAPGLWRADHAREIAKRMALDANPERQLRKASPDNPKGGLHIGYKGVQYPERSVIRDIGRVWLAQLPYRREGGKNFVRWSRVPMSAMT